MSNIYVHFSEFSFPAQYSVINFQSESHSVRFQEVIMLCIISSFPYFFCLLIEVINPVNEIIIEQSKFMTTKKSKENHGLGLTCLNEAVKRYGGSCKIYVKEKLFNVTICIPSKNV